MYISGQDSNLSQSISQKNWAPNRLITNPDLAGNLEFKLKVTSRLWDGIMWKKWKNMTHKKVCFIIYIRYELLMVV